MTDNVNNGKRMNLDIGGEIVSAGFNVVFGVPQLAYFPKSSLRPAVGLEVDLGTDGKYKILTVEHSVRVPKMVVLTMEEVVDGPSAA